MIKLLKWALGQTLCKDYHSQYWKALSSALPGRDRLTRTAAAGFQVHIDSNLDRFRAFRFMLE